MPEISLKFGYANQAPAYSDMQICFKQFNLNIQINIDISQKFSIKFPNLPFMYLLLFYAESAIISFDLSFGSHTCLHIALHYIDNVVHFLSGLHFPPLRFSLPGSGALPSAFFPCGLHSSDLLSLQIACALFICPR